MRYETKNYEGLLGTKGFSDTLLKNHFTLYEGYVKNVNRLYEDINRLFREKKTDASEYAELKRRFGWEFNGMRLHELYFGNMTKGGSSLKETSPFKKKVEADFGSFKEWEEDFKATGSLRGIGWVVCYFDPSVDGFLNVWINEHDLGHLTDCHPLLVMDVFEHAFITDYGLNKSDYIESFFRAVDWQKIDSRFETALSVQGAVAAGAR